MASNTSAFNTSSDIVNLALAHCGVSKPIANIDIEKSVEAQMLRTFIAIARRESLTKIPWSFATKQVSPALIVNFPTPEWMFAYQYPPDCLKITRFMSWRLNNDSRQSRVPYRVMQPVTANLSPITPQPKPYPQTSGQWIYTNWPGTNSSLPTIIEYTFDNSNIAQWTPTFVMAMSLKLAYLIVPTLTTGDPQSMQQKLLPMFESAINKASSDSLNEEQRPEDPESEFIRARGGDGFSIPGMTWVAEPAGFVVQ